MVATSTGTVTLDLPADMRIHDVVNVDRVKRYTPSVGEWPGRTQHNRPLPVRLAEDGTGEYEVEAILGKKEAMEGPSYLVGGEGWWEEEEGEGSPLPRAVERGTAWTTAVGSETRMSQGRLTSSSTMNGDCRRRTVGSHLS